MARLQASTKHKAAGCKYTGEPQTCKRNSPRSAERQHQNLKFDASGRQQPAEERGDGGVGRRGGATCGVRGRLAAGHDQLSGRESEHNQTRDTADEVKKVE